MDTSALLHLARQHAVLNKYTYSHENPYGQLVSPPSSYIRSSAPRPLQPIPSHYMPATASADSPPSSASSSSFPDSISEPMLDYVMQSDSSVAVGPLYNAQYVSPAQQYTWIPADTKMQQQDFYPSLDLHMPFAAHLLDDGTPRSFSKAEDTEPSLPEETQEIQPYYPFTAGGQFVSYGSFDGQSYGGAQVASAPDQLTSIHPQMLSAYSYGGPVPGQPQAPSLYDDSAESSYVLSPSAGLQYPPSPETIPRFVHPAQISPDISPIGGMAELHEGNTPPACDPRYTVHKPFTSGEESAVEPDGVAGDRSASGSPVPSGDDSGQPPAKRRRKDSISSDSSESYGTDSSGESEKDDNMDDDNEYVEGARTDSAPQQPRSRATSSPSPARSASSSARKGPRRTAAPVPIPNLTKKSRGRRVPTVRQIETDGGTDKAARTYLCDVPGCDKCFARGEHLKRHVRSIHTNEKPHKCPHCGKDFSRHDNLGQHMRVHTKGYNPKTARAA